MRTESSRGRAALLLSILSSAATLAVSQLASAETYQVGAGKLYSSLGEVADLLGPGDIVEIDGDQTYSGGTQLTQSGTAASPITIRGIRKNGKRPVLSGGTNTLEIFASHYVVEALDITAGSFRCYFHHGDDIVMRDTIIRDCPQHGILGADSDSGSLTLEYVEVHSCGQGDTRHQIYMATDESAFPGSVFRMQHCWVHDGIGGNNVKTRAERNEIYYNWIEGAYYHELELIGPDGQDPSLAREDSDVVGNVLRKTGNTFVTRLGGDGTGDTSGRYRFVHNTIVLAQGSSAVFRLFDGIESLEAHNNVFWRAGGGGVQVIQDSNASWVGGEVIGGSNNWVAQGSTAVPSQWTGTVEGADPGFVDAAGLDFSPADASALLDAAAPSPASPPGFSFPNPLAAPAWLPPAGSIEAYGTAKPRAGGVLDIGAIEKPGPDPDPSSSSSSSSSGGNGAGAGGSGTGANGSGAANGSGGGAPSGGAGGGPFGSGGSGAAPGLTNDEADEGGGSSSGCACAHGGDSDTPWAWLAAAGLGLAVGVRRSKSRRARA